MRKLFTVEADRCADNQPVSLSCFSVVVVVVCLESSVRSELMEESN